MKMMFRHLEETGQGYAEHARGALSLAGACMKASAILLVHAAWPDYGGVSGSAVLRAALARLDADDKQTKEE